MGKNPTMRLLPPTVSRTIGAAALAAALCLGVAACGSAKHPEASADTTASPTTTAPAATTMIATAKGKTLTVRETDPAANATTTTIVGATTTIAPPPPANVLPAIPRSSLNSVGAKKVAEGYEFSNPTYFKNPFVLDVIADQGEWLEVLLPVRPNHTVGWVKASDVTITTTQYHLLLDLDTFHLKLFNGNDLAAETDVVIGRDNTQTPTGRFFIQEKIEQSNPNGVYGTWIFATNGYSEFLDTFNGGLPVIALHGTNQPELIGTKSSNGCVRMPDEFADQLAATIPAGTPIDIVGSYAPAS